MIRATSKASFIENQSFFSALEQKILSVYLSGPMTAREALSALRKSLSNDECPEYGSVSGRCRELKDRGVLIECGRKKNTTKKSANILMINPDLREPSGAEA